MRAAALDIGGTSIKSGVWTGVEDKTEEVRETPTNAGLGGSYVMEQAVKILEGYRNGNPPHTGGTLFCAGGR